MRATLCFFLFFLNWSLGDAQVHSTARSLALGGSSVAMEGLAGGLLANPAFISSELQGPTLLLGYRMMYHQPDLTAQLALLVLPSRYGTLGFSFRRFGLEDAYSDQSLGLNYARKYGSSFSLGISVFRDWLVIPGFVHRNLYGIGAGMMFLVNDFLHLGLHAKLVGQHFYEMVYGLIYRFGSSVILNLDTRIGDGSALPNVNVGLAYALVPNVLDLRLGLQVRGLEPSAGFGLNLNRFVLDIGTSFHKYLGISPQIDLSYVF